MATKSAILSVRIVSDSKDFGRGFQDAESRVGRFQTSVQKAGGAMRDLEAPAAIIGGTVAAGFVTTAQMAATAEQNIGAVRTVFGEASDQVLTWSQDSANAAGMSSSAYQELAASIGGSLGSAYDSQDQVAQKTNELITASADLASVFGGTASESAAAMGAALRGEFDSLERFGIFLNAAAVEAELARTGQDKLTGSALEAAKKQATQNLIMQQAAQYQGNFAREADTAAGAQQRAAAQAQNAAAQLGTALLPLVTAAAGRFAEMATWVSENTRTVGILAAIVGGFAAVILTVNAAMRAWQVAVQLATAAQALWNIALSANPIGLVVIALAALVAGVVLAYNKVGWFRDGVNAAAAWIAGAWNNTTAAFRSAWDGAASWGRQKIDGFKNGAAAAGDAVRSKYESVTGAFRSKWESAASWGRQKIDGFKNGAAAAGDAVRSKYQEATDFFRRAWEGATGHIRGILQGWAGAARAVFDGIRAAVQGVTDFFRRAWEGAVGHVRGLIQSIRDAAGAVGGFIGLNGSGGQWAMAPAYDVPADGSPFFMTAAVPTLMAAPRFTGATLPAPTVINVNITAGVGDPVEIGREVDRVLRRYHQVVGA